MGKENPMNQNDPQQKYDSLGTAFAQLVEGLHDLWLRTKLPEERGPDSELWRLMSKAIKDALRPTGADDLEWECIFDVDHPVSEWGLEENKDLLEEHGILSVCPNDVRSPICPHEAKRSPGDLAGDSPKDCEAFTERGQCREEGDQRDLPPDPVS